jgi:hypothetical protein
MEFIADVVSSSSLNEASLAAYRKLCVLQSIDYEALQANAISHEQLIAICATLGITFRTADETRHALLALVGLTRQMVAPFQETIDILPGKLPDQ